MIRVSLLCVAVAIALSGVNCSRRRGETITQEELVRRNTRTYGRGGTGRSQAF